MNSNIRIQRWKKKTNNNKITIILPKQEDLQHIQPEKTASSKPTNPSSLTEPGDKVRTETEKTQKRPEKRKRSRRQRDFFYNIVKGETNLLLKELLA